MSRIHTVAAVLLSTGLAFAYTSSGTPSDTQVKRAPVPQEKLNALLSATTNIAPSGNLSSLSQANGAKLQVGGSQNIGTCPCAGSPPEGEANCGLPTDNINGGCNSTPIVYGSIAFPGSICGTAAWDGAFRDTDWFRFTITATTGVEWKVNAEYAVVAFILDNNCPPAILATGTAGPCADAICQATSLSPGTYVAWTGPDFGGPTFACGSSDDYKGTLSVFSCSSPANDNCASATAISGNGPWFGTNVCSVTDGLSTCGLLGADVWYNWTSNTTGTVTFNTCNAGTSYDTVLSAYDTAACLGAQLGCNDDVPCTPIFRSGLPISVVNGNVYKVQVGGYNGATGNFELNIELPCTTPTNDNCASATAISGNGPFLGTNCAAVLDGPATCGLLGADVWYNWTSNTTGPVLFNLCNPGTTYDTVISVYDTSACQGAQLGCNDDVTCPQIFRSALQVNVINGNLYKVQVGGYNATEGDFELTIELPPPPPDFSVCQYDTGVSSRAWTLSGAIGEEMIWLTRFGDVGDTTLVSAILGTFGSPADGFTASPNGTPARFHIWDDPNDDGNPIDAVLLQSVNTTVQFSDTDTFQTSALSPSVVVSGAYFIGASIVTTATPAQQVNMSIDHSFSYPGITWVFGNPGGLADVNNLGNNSFSLDMDTFDPGVWMLRSTCGAPITGFCYPGAGAIPCPCANPPGGPLRSCNNFGSFTGGAALVGTGNPSLAADTLVLSATGENNTALTVFWGGNVDVSPGFPNGAGVRCISTSLKRLYKGNASGGTIVRPGMGDPNVHTAQGGISAGQTRYYYNTYRDPNAAGPCGNSSSTINTTNAVAVTWTP